MWIFRKGTRQVCPRLGRKWRSGSLKIERGQKMSIKKSKFSVAKVLNKKGTIVGYLSTRDEENGLDIRLDTQGYTIVAL